MNKLQYLFKILIVILLLIPFGAAAKSLSVSVVQFTDITRTSVEMKVRVVNNSSYSNSEVWLSCNNVISNDRFSMAGSGILTVSHNDIPASNRHDCSPNIENSGGELSAGYGRSAQLRKEPSSIVAGGSSVSVSGATQAAIVFTHTAAEITANTAILNAQVNGGGGALWWFEYGETDSLGKKTPEIGISFREDVNTYIGTLKPETLYYFRVAARNKFGVKYGNTFVFRTATSDGSSNTAGSNSNTGLAGSGGDGSTGGGVSNGGTLVEVRHNTTIIDGVIPAGEPVVAWFEYGKTNRLGNKTEEQTFDGKKDYVFSDTLYNLDADTEYYVQSVYERDGQTVRGEMVSFSTSPNGKRESVVISDSNSNTSPLAGLLGGGAQDQDAAAGGIFDIFNRNQSEKSATEMRREVEESVMGGLKQSESYLWGEYLQNRFFSISNNAAVFGFDVSQFKPYNSQLASAAGGASILPNSFLDWFIIIIVLIIVIAVARRFYLSYEKKKKEREEQKRLQEEERGMTEIAA